MGKAFHILALMLLLSLTSMQKARAENGEILFGAAAITGAVSAMVVPAIMSQAQTNVARINAQTSTTISQMNAQTSLYQAQLQSQMAMANAASSMQIASYNQQSQTRDLLSQLQFLAYNRALDNQLAKMRTAQELELQNNLLILEAKKMELSQVLAEARQLGGAPVGTGVPNLANVLPANPGATTPLAASLSANAQLKSGEAGMGNVQSSLGLRRALTASISSGSTQNSRRAISRDLTNMINSTAVDTLTAYDGPSRRVRESSPARAIASHHRR
ncbi:MAG: hypothetical protein ACKN9V_07585 [Pseudomonadota bacterium]